MSDPTLSPEAFVLQVQAQLHPLGDPSRARAMSAYMRDHFAFLGVRTPDRRRATLAPIRRYQGDCLSAALALWAEPQREFQYVACDLLRRHSTRLGPQHLPQLEALVTSKSWWDTVDSLAVVIGDVVLRHPTLVPRMDALLREPDLWLRRTALLHQLAWKTRTDERRLFRACLQCAGETEFFIKKAIGWALRQYARVNPEAVADFVSNHRSQLQALSVREASKHLSSR